MPGEAEAGEVAPDMLEASAKCCDNADQEAPPKKLKPGTRLPTSGNLMIC